MVDGQDTASAAERFLPWFGLANLVGTFVVGFALRAFMVGKWSQRREAGEADVTRRVEYLDAQITYLKGEVTLIRLQQARDDERLKRCESHEGHYGRERGHS